MALDRRRDTSTVKRMNLTDEFALWLWAAKGDHDAACFLQQVTDAAHVWDDVVDGDAPLDRDALNAAFKALVLDIPTNLFYRAHRPQLDTLMQQAAVNWRVATSIERDAGAGKHVAYILRSSYMDLVSHVALVLGGPDWAEVVCRRVRDINQSEAFDDYLTNLDREACARAEA